MVRVALLALACFITFVSCTVLKVNREAMKELQTTAGTVAKHLELQLIRIETGFDTTYRFPDWDFLIDLVLKDGLCAQYLNSDGSVVRASCGGRGTPPQPTPNWFAIVYELAFSPGEAVERAVTTRLKAAGRVVVAPESQALMARAWQEIIHMLPATIVTIVVLCLLVELPIYLSLRPTKAMVAGLDRIAQGDLEYRLPSFRAIDLRRISEVVNQMASSLKTTLSDRAELSARLITTQEQERRHLAQELHDEFGQSLTAINVLAASIDATAHQVCPVLSSEAETLSQISMTMMDTLRSTLLRLEPTMLDELGLVPSLTELVASWNRNAGRSTRFEFITRGSFADLSDPTVIHLFRIAQEGLTNAVKHADARNVRLTLERQASQSRFSGATGIVELIIEDDGKGYDVGAASGGQGLGGIRRRTAELGGVLEITSKIGEGTRLYAKISIDPNRNGTLTDDLT